MCYSTGLLAAGRVSPCFCITSRTMVLRLLLPEAMAYGTEYIQTKAQCLHDLEMHPRAERIVAVFPTLVFGGRVFSCSWLVVE